MTQRVDAERLLAFTRQVFQRAGLASADAGIVADALVTTDLRGIDSHGVAHMGRYVRGLLNGSLNCRPNMRILRETPSTARLDCDRAVGFVAAHRAMQLAIAKAKAVGTGWVVTQRSAHYGAAGYWAGLALEHGLIGVSLCASAPRIVPTFGARGCIGTNPIAVAIPAGVEPPFLLDMATCVVPMGRLEIYRREKKPLPEGWVIDVNGNPVTDSATALPRAVSGDAYLLPLGGAGETHGGHKGYGLGLAVELLTQQLAGYTRPVSYTPGQESELAQFFGALAVEAFLPLAEFTAAVDGRLRECQETPPLPGHERVLVAGQKEWEATLERREKGIPLHEEVIKELAEIGQQLNVPLPW